MSALQIRFDGFAQIVVGDINAATAVRSARGQENGLVGVEFRRRAEMGMGVDDLFAVSF